ncbi:MAG: hypothetical protein WD314_03110 [Trueperaceae bacterium]
MRDRDFANAVDAALWISPSGASRDNGANLAAVRSSIEERSRAIVLLNELLVALLPLYLWRSHVHMAPPILEALLFVQEQAGGQELAAPPE